MILSIVILSYNRPDQLKRILENMVGVRSSDFEIVVKDDRSPRHNEIADIVRSYQDDLEFKLRLHLNEENLGYDLNLLDSFNIVDSNYVFLLSDDDYLDGHEIGNLISIIEKNNHSVYFTPYFKDGVWRRSFNYKVEPCNFSKVIYDSILFSGIVFEVSVVRKLDKNLEFLSKCIYSQVYLSSLLVFFGNSVGRCPEGILYLGGDGENFFGKNQAAKDSSLLEDRSKITSNLDYQGFLIEVVKVVSEKTSPVVFESFFQEYKKRILGYALSVRALGFRSYYEFFNYYKKSGPHTGNLNKILLCGIFLVPSLLASNINRFGVKFLRKSG